MKYHISLVILITCLFIQCISNAQKNQDALFELGKDSRFDCVVKILNKDVDGEWGSGVLINENFVLTAAHVLMIEETKDTSFVDGPFRYTTYVMTGQHLDSNISNYVIYVIDQEYLAKNVVVHPEYNFKSGECDIALIELNKPCESIQFPVLNDEIDEMGRNAFLVGYGLLSNKIKGNLEIGLQSKRKAGMNTVDSVGGYVLNEEYAELFCDYDHPKKTKYNVTGDPIALENEIAGFPGDSGGGLFVENEDGLVLIGILTGEGFSNSRLTSAHSYGIVNKSIRMKVFIKWVSEVATK